MNDTTKIEAVYHRREHIELNLSNLSLVPAMKWMGPLPLTYEEAAVLAGELDKALDRYESEPRR